MLPVMIGVSRGMTTMDTPWTAFVKTTRFHVPAKGAGKYDPAHIRIHKVVVGVGLALGALGVLAALGCAGVCVMAAHSAKTFSSFATTLTFGIVTSLLIPPGCYFIGTSLVLAFTPTRFLRGPIGQKWLGIAGVQGPLLARVLFILIPALTVGIVVAIVVTLMPPT
jgi:hypothetical protein